MLQRESIWGTWIPGQARNDSKRGKALRITTLVARVVHFEGILDEFHFLLRRGADSHHVEPARNLMELPVFDISESGLDHAPLLLRGDRKLGRAVGVACSGLDLHEDHRPRLPCPIFFRK